MDLSAWSISDFAAWWGAIVATLALVWNIVVALRDGPRVTVRAVPDMQIFPKDPITGDKTYVSVTAVNRGNAPTTITHFCGYYSKNLWSRLFGKRQEFMIMTNPLLGKDVPYVLRPGEEWSSMADENDMLKKLGAGYLYLGVLHNQSKKPCYVRVRIRSNTQLEGVTPSHA